MEIHNYFIPNTIPIEQVDFKGAQFDVLRLDKIHAGASGNKFFKLKYNFKKASEEGYKKVLTFGGAFSNHIAATAIAAHACGFESVGIIRGEAVHNPTLRLAQENGMKIEFIKRGKYRDKEAFLREEGLNYKDCYVIPEGGTNDLAIQGTEEIHYYIPHKYDIICTAFGTGGTIAGLINGRQDHQEIWGISSLKGSWPKEEIQQLIQNKSERWKILTNYHFGGYAKWDNALIDFIHSFYEATGIPLDPVYNGKVFFGLVQELQKLGYERQKKILAIHSGGLQGIEGFNLRFGTNLPQE